MNIPDRVFQRAITRYDTNYKGCFISRYSSGSHGYAQIGCSINGKNYVWVVHRVVWEFYRGKVPENMTVDHICHVRKCINIDHLRLLSNKVNAADNSQIKTRIGTGRICRRGLHEIVVDSKGNTGCRECHLERRRERKAKGIFK